MKVFAKNMELLVGIEGTNISQTKCGSEHKDFGGRKNLVGTERLNMS